MPTDRDPNLFPKIGPAGPLPKVNSIFDFSADALAQLRLWLEQNPPAIGISNILGFSQFTAEGASPVITQETTTSGTYTDLATVGPTITGLSDGQYVILFGSLASTSVAGTAAIMSVQLNSATASDNDLAQSQSTNPTSIARGIVKTLANSGNNTITAKYRTDGTHTGTFSNRWLVALKFANK